jgi:protein LSM14
MHGAMQEVHTDVEHEKIYKKDDFFDMLSCEALGTSGANVSEYRSKAAEQKRIDMETFGGLGGVPRHHSHYHHHHGGGGGGGGYGQGRGGGSGYGQQGGGGRGYGAGGGGGVPPAGGRGGYSYQGAAAGGRGGPAGGRVS